MKVITNRLMTIGDAILKKNKVIGVKKLPKEKKKKFYAISFIRKESVSNLSTSRSSGSGAASPGSPYR